MKNVKSILLIIASLLPFLTNAQNTYVNKEGKTHYLGRLSIDELFASEFKDWNIEYNVEQKLPSDISTRLEDYKVKVFLGTWCGDSKEWLPQFIQLWEKSGLSRDQLELIALHNEGNQYKRSPEEYEKGLNVHRVPTFIFYKNGEEKARIVERPINDLLTDVAQIALGVPSKERYRAISLINKAWDEKPIDSLYAKHNYQPLLRKTYREVSTSGELNNYGYVLKAAGEMEKAEFAFYLNRNLFKTNPNTWDSLGEICFDQEKYDEAKVNYEKVLELDPKNANAEEMLAKIKSKKNGM